MKVASSSDDRLVVVDRPLLVAGFLWAAGIFMVGAGFVSTFESASPGWLVRVIFLVFGFAMLGIAWWYFPFQRFEFDRVRGTFEHRSVRPLRTSTVAMELSTIERVEIEKIWGEDSWLDRVVLDLGVATHPLEPSYTGSSRAPIMREINAWLVR